MKATFTKISIFAAITVVLFGGISLVTGTADDVFTQQAFALTGCSDCGEDDGGTPGGDDGGGDIVPTCVMTAAPSTVTTGGKTTLTWTTSRAVTAKINQGVGNVAVGTNKTHVVTVDATKTYTMTVTAAGGNTAVCTAKVTVTTPSVPLPTCTLSANPATITTGGTTKLTWSTQNAVSASINQGIGAVDPKSTSGKVVSPLATKTYTMTVTNSAGVSKTCAATVNVNVITIPAPTCTLAISPTTITNGQTAKLTWTTSNAVSASINHGVGSVDPKSTAGKVVTPDSSRTYTMTVTNSAGVSKTCAAAITVKETPVVPVPTCTLTATPTTITNGQTSKLTWTTSNAVSASINQGIGAVDPKSTVGKTISPTGTLTYTMTVTNSAGVSKTCAATVTVTVVTVPAPTCTLAISPTTITNGETAKLTWSTQNAVSASINHGVGSVDPKSTAGKVVTPDSSRTYTMTVTNSAGVSKTCAATVTVKETPVVPAPTCALTATPASITTGGTSKVTWMTSNAVSASINQGIGAVDPKSTAGVSVSPLATKTYTMTVTNSAGVSKTCAATVTVSEAPVIPAPTCTLTATPMSIKTGEMSKLTWSTQNAVSASINQGIGAVDPKSTVGKTIAPTATKTYTMTVTNSAGVPKTCAATVTVSEAPVIPVPTCTLTATPSTVTKGDTAKLTWSTQNAVSASINQGIGAVDPKNTSAFKAVSPLATKTYTMTVTNSAGVSKTCATTITVKEAPVVPAPTCTLAISPTTITNGQTAKLTWSTQNAVSASINQGIGAVDPKSTAGKVVTPDSSRTYTMTVTNSAGVSKTCTTTITVKEAPVIPAPTCELTATPTTITKGDTAKLTWMTSNAVSASIDQGIGAVDPKDTNAFKSVAPTATKIYTMTVTNSAGVSKTCATTVTVKEKPVIPAPTCTLNATPTALKRGETAKLTWSTQNAVSATINQGIGAVDPKNSTDFRTVKPTKTITYTMTVTNSAGVSKTCARTITVTDTPAPLSCAANVDFYATRATIDEGEDSTLIWETTGITSLSISGISSTALDGSAVVSPRSDTTYTMTATNGAATIKCPVTIVVEEDEDEDEDDGGGGGSSTPRCDLDLSDTKIRRGERVTLTWATSNATDVLIKDNHGKTLVTTEDVSSSKKKDLYDGDMTLRPEEDTTYTLIAERGSKDRTCTIKVKVEDSLTVISDRDQQPLVGGISLDDVPYTGFAAGPFLTMLFYGVLLLWALYLAYVLVVRRNSVGGVALAPLPVAPATATVTNPHANTAVFVPEIKPVPAFVATAATADTMATPLVLATPAATPVVGYATAPRDTAYDAVAGEIEARAHAARILLSSEAMRQLVNETNVTNRAELVEAAFAKAKASYPAEDGWVVINEERVKAILPTTTPVMSTFTPAAVAQPVPLTAGNSSLAEAIVSGNIVAAYQMIGHRPMIALADAAAELDVLLRAKRGETVAVSAMLMNAALTNAQLEGAIAALTGALDGTYTDEASAVKMAMMKAVKAIHG